MRGLGATCLVVAALAALPAAGSAQVPVGKEAVEALRFGPLEFDQPRPERHRVEGVRVILLEDRTLPLVNVLASFKGGYGLFGRQSYAAATGLPALLRYGGTETLTPAEVDVELESYAIQTSFGSGSGGISATMNTLTEHLGTAMELWGAMLAEPRFDPHEIEVWRGRLLDGILRRGDNPAGLAFSEFNRLLYGDHPIGWEMEAADLAPELVERDDFFRLHERIVCRDNLLLGVTGDASWSEIEPLLRQLVERLPECAEPLPEPPIPDIRREPGVFLIEKDLEQAVIVMAHPTSLRLADDTGYFAATIGNSILGAGGFSSRIMERVRTEEGYAYSASSLWTTPRRYDGLIGAVTRTRPENAVPAIRLILTTMDGLREEPPTQGELRTAVDRIVNGFVFNFETPTQIVSRAMSYLIQELPEDWLERYLRGVQHVSAADVRRAFDEYLRPDRMSILIVGDPERIGLEGLRELGPVTVLDSATP